MEEIDVYEQTYDYDDMKIAIVIQDYLSLHKRDKLRTYEELIQLAYTIKQEWLKEYDNATLNEEERAYIQFYAYRYLDEHLHLEENNIC